MNHYTRWVATLACVIALTAPLTAGRVVAGVRSPDAAYRDQANGTRLRLTALCSPDPATQRVWRVRNTNPFPVSFTWDVYGSTSGQAGSGIVPAASDSAPGEVVFATATEAGPNTLRVFVENVQQGVKASNPAQCE